MSEWISKPLNQLASFQKGRKVETSEHPRDGFAPYLGASAISGTVEEYGDSRFGVMASVGDVLMLWDGERSGLVGKTKTSGVISSTVVRLSSKGEIGGDYLYYALNLKFDWIQNRRTGTGVPHVPKDLGRILSIPFPRDLNEQRKIVEILVTVDEAIEQTEAVVQKWQQMKAGLMHDLFTRGVTPDGNLRPTRQEAPQLYKNSDLGWIPKEWNAVRLDKSEISIIDGDRGENYPQAHELLDSGHCLFLSATNVTARGFKFDELQFISSEKDQLLGTGKLSRGDVVVTTRGTVGNIACYDADVPFSDIRINSGMIILRCNRTDLSPEFLYCSLTNYIFGHEFGRVISGSAQPQLPIKDFKRFHCLILPSPEQQAILSKANAASGYLISEEERVFKLRAQKQGLMQDLLTGRVPVKVGVGA
ncbi:MAG: restriction endonuclease subunit S [Verrucomicrobiota bacterium]|jgi:type I restriction enzyme S subunit